MLRDTGREIRAKKKASEGVKEEGSLVYWS
jgi:hypothetical protein